MGVRTESGPRLPIFAGVNSLLRKDLAVFVPRDRFLVGLIYLLGHPTVLPNEEAFFWLGIALAGTLVAYVPIMEWHQESDRMLSSLPVRRGTIVLSRYLSSIVACGFRSDSVDLHRTLSGPDPESASGSGEAAPGIWTTFEGTLAFVLVAGLLVSLFLPLYFRFGLGRGAMVFFASCIGLFVLASIPSGPVMPGNGVVSWIREAVGSMGPGWVLFLVLGGLATMLAVSGSVSTGVFRRRDL